MHTKAKRILLTGGGTGGHITPNIALIEFIREEHPDWELIYMGSINGMEKTMIPDTIPYIGVATGKIRRYFSFQNAWDIAKVATGIVRATMKLRELKPDAIYAKGGYVSIPALVAGKLLRIPTIVHESDVAPGLATRIGAKFAKTICASFPQTQTYFPKKKIVVTGLPLRNLFSQGSPKEGLRLTAFTRDLPILLVMGGSQGAMVINQFVWDHLRHLLPYMQIIHIVGKGNLKKIDWNRMFLEELAAIQGVHQSSNHPEAHAFQQQMIKQQKEQDLDELTSRYKQFQFLAEEFAHIVAAADVVMTRAGATTVMEMSKMQKPCIFIPLGTNQSRGDQIKNAEVLETQGACVILTEEELAAHTQESIELIKLLTANKDRQEVLKQRIRKFHIPDAAESICRLIEAAVR